MAKTHNNDAINFVIHSIHVGQFHQLKTEDLLWITMLDPIGKTMWLGPITPDVNLHGWKFNGDKKVGAGSGINATSWVKGTLEIFLVNESERVGEGHFDIAVASNAQEPLELFKEDFNFRGSIEAKGMLQETIST